MTELSLNVGYSQQCFDFCLCLDFSAPRFRKDTV